MDGDAPAVGPAQQPRLSGLGREINEPGLQQDTRAYWLQQLRPALVALSPDALRTAEAALRGAVAGCVGNGRGCLRRDDGIASGGEVNHALGRQLIEALPAIDLAHVDLT